MINKKFSLNDLGWNTVLEEQFKKFAEENGNLLKVGRVAVEHKELYRIYTEDGEILGKISGKMQHNATRREDYPAVGDWVIIDRTDQKTGNAIIHGILQRKSKFSRKIAGDQVEEQIVAVNVDWLFICMSLNNDFNISRLDRYLTMAWKSGSSPVVVLTKADLCDDIDNKVSQVEATAFGINIHVVSAIDGTGFTEITQYITPGKTISLLGSSGVGKSTLINYLLGEDRLATKEIREDDDKGKHTTTHRELILLKDGGIIIDTPGMRELHILDANKGLSSTFRDIEELALQCKFKDCRHDKEPGCAIKNALKNGTLSQKRYENYIKLQKEAAYIERKNSMKANRAEKLKWKAILKW